MTDTPLDGSGVVPNGDRREVRRLQRQLVDFLRSDLYQPVRNREDADPTCDGEWESPLKWRVRLRRLDLQGITENDPVTNRLPQPTGPIQIDVTVFDPSGEVYATVTDIGSAHQLDEMLP